MWSIALHATTRDQFVTRRRVALATRRCSPTSGPSNRSLFEPDPFHARTHGIAVIRKITRDGDALLTRPNVESNYDVWLASFHVSRPLPLEEALGLVDAAVCVDSSLKEETQRKYRLEIARVVTSAVLRGLQSVDELTPGTIREVIYEATRRNGQWIEASISKRRARRAAFTYFFRTLVDLGLADSNPASVIHLPSRPTSSARPLTDEEMETCQDAAHYGIVPDTRPVALALTQCGAATGEAALVRADYVDLSEGVLYLPGSTYTYPRCNYLTDWAHRTLTDRIDDLRRSDSTERPLVVGLDIAQNSATAMVSGYLRDLLRIAQLNDNELWPSSFRAWGARKVYDQRGLEAAASFLGLESFDRTADIIALERSR